MLYSLGLRLQYPDNTILYQQIIINYRSVCMTRKLRGETALNFRKLQNNFTSDDF